MAFIMNKNCNALTTILSMKENGGGSFDIRYTQVNSEIFNCVWKEIFRLALP
jgi:hypothetical protein